MNLLDLPDTVLMDILELLSYDEVAKKREVRNTMLHSSGRFYNVLRYVSRCVPALITFANRY